MKEKRLRYEQKNWKTRFTGTKNRAWLFFNIVWTVIYLLWRGFRTLPLEFGIISIIAGVYLFIVEMLGMFEALVHYFNMHKIEIHEIPVVPLEEYPDIDVLIATYNESVELLYKTVNGCVNMKYPDKNKVHIYLCDDGRRVEVKELAEKMGVGYLYRDDNKGAKAGNLNNALSLTDSPLIATFDADMIPKNDFLMVTAAYFVDQWIKNRELDEKRQIKLGFIQSPQSFYNPDLFQFNLFSEGRIPNEQDYFYKDIQIARNKSNSVIYGGSNTLISREALDDVGGFYTGSITEDFATGILIQKKGYLCFGINTVLASGLSPTSIRSLITQRIRWARGCIQTGRRMHIILSRHLSLSQKVNYMASIWYWYASWKRLIYILAPILFATFNIMVVKCNIIEVLIFWLPMYISSNVCLRMLSRNIRTTKWTNLYETVIFPYMLIPTLLETFGISMKKFKVTKKDGSEKTESNLLYTIPHLTLIVLSVIGIVNCIRWTFDTGRIDYFVILFWLFLNLYNLVMSVFFIIGRKAVRNAERQRAEISCTVKTSFENEEGVTTDISESGVSILVNNTMDIDEGEEVFIALDDGRYKADIKGIVVLVEQSYKQWRYVFRVIDLLNSKAEYMQLIYDREPSLPTNLDESLSSFDDLRINVKKRLVSNSYSNRGRARIPINEKFDTNVGREVFMVNYNYEYVLLKEEVLMPEEFEIVLEKGDNSQEALLLKVALFDRGKDGERSLYRVFNYRTFHDNKYLHSKLALWIRAHSELDEKYSSEKVDYKKMRLDGKDEFSELQYL